MLTVVNETERLRGIERWGQKVRDRGQEVNRDKETEMWRGMEGQKGKERWVDIKMKMDRETEK